MIIALGSEHRGFPHKTLLLEILRSRGVQAEDLGCFDEQSADYPDPAFAVAEMVASGKADAGVLICGSGIGMSIAANKVKGARAAVVTDAYTAAATRAHNDANVICVGARVTGIGVALSAVSAFRDTEFEGGRHGRRVSKLDRIERGD